MKIDNFTIVDKILDEEYKNSTHRVLDTSIVSKPCNRYLWLMFHWALPTLSGLRILQKKHEDAAKKVVKQHLLKIGCEIEDKKTIELSNHIYGNHDGIITGVYAAEKTSHILIIDFVESSVFNLFKENTLQTVSYEKFVECQILMAAESLQRCLYLCINKDNSEYISERVKYDMKVAIPVMQRAISVIQEDVIPDGISFDSNSITCKECPAKEFCFETGKTKQVNCRTCAWSSPHENYFICKKHNSEIPIEHQDKVYDCHSINPELVPWIVESDLPKINANNDYTWSINYFICENVISNGEGFEKSSRLLIDDELEKIIDEIDNIPF